MAFLMEQNRHPTAVEIFEAVNRMDPRSSRATTYNNLRDLVQAGLVREVAVEGRAALRCKRLAAPSLHLRPLRKR
jgi:Fur family transcriptional regulator, peroxide stress response regulator